MDIRNKVIGGVKWTSVSTGTQALVGLLKLSILARYLDKEDFGLMALVMFVLGFMELFMDMGLSTAILHKQGITKKEYSSLYWINFIFSLGLYLVLLVITGGIASFYDEPELSALLPLMGCSLILAALGRQFRTIEQKELNFRLIAIVIILGSVSSLVLAVILAIKGFGVYALVLSALLQHLVTNAIFFSIGIRKYGVKFHLSFKEAKPFLQIGMYHVGGQMMNYFSRDIDILLVGKFFGSETLGGYSLAKQLVIRPFRIFNPILTRVGAPVLAKFQNDMKQLRQNYLKLVNAVSTVIVPVYLGLILFAPFAVRLLYGQDFLDIVSLVRILSVYMIFRSIANPMGSLMVATGRTDLGFVWNIITFMILPLAVWIGSQFTIEWVALCLTLTMAILFIPGWWFLVRRMIEVRLFTYIYWIIPGVSLMRNNSRLENG